MYADLVGAGYTGAKAPWDADWGQRYAVRTPQSVVDEMRWLRDNVQPDHIWFMDDIMGIQDRWIEEFADLLDQRPDLAPHARLARLAAEMDEIVLAAGGRFYFAKDSTLRPSLRLRTMRV